MTDILDDPTLKNPDAADDIKYTWDDEFQRHVVALLIADRQFMLQSLDLIKPSYFTNRAHSKVCEIASNFFKKYRILPRKDFIIQELKTEFGDNKALPYFLSEVTVLFDYFQPGLESREYLQDKIIYFAKIQSVKNAFHESLKDIDKAPESEDTWAKVYDRMRDAMTTNQNFELGLDYFKSMKDRYVQKDEDAANQERFITGFESIDKEIGNGGYSKGELISVVAGSGVGKSIWLACLTATNLLRGKKGVYITLELAEDKVAERMDAILTGFPIQNLCAYKLDIFEKISTLKGVKYEGDLYPLIIKQFPAGTATVNTIRAYISQLRFHNFDPDFVIVDYVGEMQDYPDMKTYESREKIVRDLRGMAMEEKVFVATAMQPNRDSKKEKGVHHRIDDEHLADAYGQIRPLDGCISLNQNDNEKQLGLGRAYIIKQRDGKSRYQIYLKFDKENLRITEITQDEYKLAMNALKEYVSDDTTVDMVKKIDSVKKKNWKPEGDENLDAKIEDTICPFGSDAEVDQYGMLKSTEELKSD